MTNEFVDNVILRNMMNVNGTFNMSYCRSFRIGRYKNINNYILSRFPDSDKKYGEVFLRIKYHIEKRNYCKVCGNKTKYDSEKYYLETGYFYRPYCCSKCAAQETKIKNKETCLKKYGVEYISQYEGFREKVKETCLKKYGVECNLANKDNIKKQQRTCLEKYGTIYPNKNEIVKEKTRKTLLDRYGVKCGYNKPDVMARMKSKESQLRRFEALKRNKSYVKSIPEEKLSDLLIEKYGENNIERQFISEEYPWHVDFYIKSIDTYIELQGMWTHGKHPYDKDSEEDQLTLQQWQQKADEGSKFYKNAIDTWTVADVKKREIAKKNNLNFIEVFDKNFEILYSLSIL